MKKSFLVILLGFTIHTSYSQKIDKSKNELKSGSSSSNSSSNGGSANTSHSVRSSSNSNDFGLVGLIAEGFLYVTFYSTIGDYRNENHLYNSLSKYPYADGDSGNFQSNNDSINYGNLMRLDVENHFLYSSNTSFGNHLKVKFRPFQYFYLQADYKELIEKKYLYQPFFKSFTVSI